MQKEQYDDEFLLLLIEYRSMYPESEHFDIFYGRYAFFYGNCKVALEHAGRAFKKRKVHPEVWKLFIDCYLALGMPERAIPFQGYCNRFAGMALEITLPLEHLARCIGELAVSLGRAEYAPLCQKKCSLINGKLDCHPGAFSGEAIPFSLDGEGYAYWVGAYNELGRLGGHGGLMESVASSLKVLEAAGAEFVFDIMRSKVGKNFFVDTQETPVIVPLASAAEENQEAHFECGTIVDSGTMGVFFFPCGTTHQDICGAAIGYGVSDSLEAQQQTEEICFEYPCGCSELECVSPAGHQVYAPYDGIFFQGRDF